jgi:hypothetical protein
VHHDGKLQEEKTWRMDLAVFDHVIRAIVAVVPGAATGWAGRDLLLDLSPDQRRICGRRG